MSGTSIATMPGRDGLIQFAKDTQGSAIVPPAYRQWRDRQGVVHVGDPGWRDRKNGLVVSEGEPRVADILMACTLGASMGLTNPMEALMRIYVIGGRPTASAELGLSKARDAGHKVRIVLLDGDNPGWKVMIERADDKGFWHEVVLRLSWARAMGYTVSKPGKNGGMIEPSPQWRDDPLNMLRHRAVVRCIRQACPEVLFGTLIPDEAERLAEIEDDAEPPAVASAEVVRAAIGSPDTPAGGEVIVEAEAELVEQAVTMRDLTLELKRLGLVGDDAREKVRACLEPGMPHASELASAADLTEAELALAVETLRSMSRVPVETIEDLQEDLTIEDPPEEATE
jgi:hypothetical protein